MENDLDLNKYSSTYSAERLKSFKYSEYDTLQDIVNNYKNNIIISRALYSELCTLEIILRNSINNLLENKLSPNWIEEEVKNNKLLELYDYQTLLKTYEDTKKDCLTSSKDFTMGRVVANLNFGFWTNLCVKKYNSKIWNKPQWFKCVFVHCLFSKGAINNISNKLYVIRRFRNRIFHYEKIFKYPARTLALYNDILEILPYLPNDELQILKETSTFLDTYNSLTKGLNIKKT